jgi:hypothetical protein
MTGTDQGIAGLTLRLLAASAPHIRELTPPIRKATIQLHTITSSRLKSERDTCVLLPYRTIATSCILAGI